MLLAVQYISWQLSLSVTVNLRLDFVLTSPSELVSKVKVNMVEFEMAESPLYQVMLTGAKQ